MDIFVSLLFLFLGTIGYASTQDGSLPLELPAIETESGTCPSAAVREAARQSILQQVESLVQDQVIPTLHSRPPCPCGGPGHWTKIAYLNMTDPTQQCPPNFGLITTPVRGCGRGSAFSGLCKSVTFPSNGKSYSRVCGRVNAYQRGSTDAFDSSVRGIFDVQNPGLEDPYLDGVSLTHGTAGSRQHIWSFASAQYETDPLIAERQFSVCPCTTSNIFWPFQVPSFVGNNYFCDTGNTGPGFDFSTIYADDPLWDGEGCDSTSTSTCCEFNHPPWFCTTLPQMTTDDIEVRICHDESALNEDNIISLIDIYVR